MKNRRFDTIKDLLKGSTPAVNLCHLRGVYTLIAEGKANNITKKEACQVIQDNPDIKITHFNLMQRKWDRGIQEFTGSSDPQPDIFEGLQVNTIDVDNPEVVREYINIISTGKSGYLNTRMPVHGIAPGTTIILIPD